jgi:hypothetical protein
MTRAGEDLDEIAAWTLGHRRGVGLRLLGVGLLVLLPAGLVFATYPDLESERFGRVQVFAVVSAVIGASLCIAGILGLLRARVGIEPAVPSARVRKH